MHALISPQQGRWGLLGGGAYILSRMRLTNRQKLSGCGLLCATRRHVPKTFGAPAKMEHHVSGVIRALLDGE